MVNLISTLFAIALFAHQYGVTCQKCHTVIPHLNEFGLHFLASGDRIPGVSAGPALPLSTKFNLVDSSENQGDGPNGEGLPKAIVDEIELFTAGTIGTRGSFFVEQYLVDGGEHGLLRDAWISDRINPWNAKIPLYGQVGSFTLPLPVDPETFRETYEDYAPYVQTVGTNPFNFFDPKTGGKLTIGDTLRGLNVQLFAGPGYDRVSGLAKTGTDTMEFISDVIGPVTPGFYHYSGERPLNPGPLDQFTRNGYSFVVQSGPWTSESLIQTGWDSNPGTGFGVASSSGFEQLRFAISRRFFALARYEGTSETLPGTFSRDGVVLLGYGPSRNARITIEDVITHTPQTNNTMNLQFTVGY